MVCRGKAMIRLYLTRVDVYLTTKKAENTHAAAQAKLCVLLQSGIPAALFLPTDLSNEENVRVRRQR